MKWSEIDTAIAGLKKNLEKAGARIETAQRNGQQIGHANHKPWYTKKIHVVQRRFLFLKRRLEKLSGFSARFEKLEAQLGILRNVSNDTAILKAALAEAKSSVRSLRKAILRRQEKDYDAFTAHRGEVLTNRKLCFVMIPFKPEFNPAYAAIRRAVRSKGLKCVRSKDVFNTRAVILDIWENMRKSIVCIADASPPNNPNVFYEIGMAHALPKRVVLISRELKPPEEKYPFDINYVRCIFYKQTAFGYRELEQAISRTLQTVLR